ncbi:MAG: hypothetical protein A2086_11115 [Spirochaetes bacterium GWD1_27_9]|nr:MAG: hypothetical protein A2Z98_01575 [Spirochaetes bacterium GWB1_27_13]OHD22768.1 MAG: hypothetical protein A2Y34_00185 [Spirochaetes bacterium GWC1_27_15]OHD39100.1 MAG: hypothetical protein A2086_11115 [Spirochaetes bacterium GWD1_27_9]
MKRIISFIYIKFIGLVRFVFKKTKKLLLSLENNAKSNLDNKNNQIKPNLQKRLCHYNHLFINHDGDIFPCCLKWMDKNMKVANLKDDNLIDDIKNFYHPCTCEKFELQKPTKDDKITIFDFNLEMSLLCQAHCSMCCVDAPSYNANYDYYDKLTFLIEQFHPKEITVQGGEILVQKKSLEWIEYVKKNYNINFTIVTNASVNIDILEKVESLFSLIKVSFVGFQPETYKRIMGLDFNKTLNFVEELNRRKIVRLSLKYLVTPLNIHEANLFLDWAINIKPNDLIFFESSSMEYINFITSDNYWDKICERTGNEIKKILLKNKDIIKENSLKIMFSNDILRLYKLDINFNQFLSENNLDRFISKYLS